MGTKEKILLEGIDTVIIRVSNIVSSKEWYINKLGLSPAWEESHMNLVVLDTNGPTSLTLWETDQTVKANKETASYPIFKTSDALALKAQLEQRGVQTGEMIRDEYVKYFFFYDPDGNVLEACEVHV